MDAAAHFTAIWASAAWGEPRSSAYSRPEFASGVMRELPRFIERYGIRSMLDAPCGDLTWIRQVRFPPGFRYIGADVVAALIAQVSAAHPGWDLRVLDLLADRLPLADLWLCRDCLTLYSWADQERILRQFLDRRTGGWLALTSHFNHSNADEPSGREREVNYRAAPFCFPPPAEQVVDWAWEEERPGLKPRALCFWRRESLPQLLGALQ